MSQEHLRSCPCSGTRITLSPLTLKSRLAHKNGISSCIKFHGSRHTWGHAILSSASSICTFSSSMPSRKCMKRLEQRNPCTSLSNHKWRPAESADRLRVCAGKHQSTHSLDELFAEHDYSTSIIPQLSHKALGVHVAWHLLVPLPEAELEAGTRDSFALAFRG